MQLKSVPAAADRVRTFAELAALVMFAALITAFVEYGIPFLILMTFRALADSVSWISA